jgi:NADPH-dependent 2,4-dienoyl-CoA reductase/sulfur reductase-like enzyme
MIDLLVVGAGPAGLAAAARAGELGLKCLVVDENAEGGGQYYRQPALAGVAGADARQRRGQDQIDRAASVASLRLGCSAYGIDAGQRVWLADANGVESVLPRAVLLATGAHDTPVAFPGWTLPGVMAAGAAQVLVKNQRVRPGLRAVVAGSGPFLLVVANQLRRAGVHVVEVVEATTLRRALPFVPASLRNPGRYGELAGYALPLVAAGVPIRRGEVVAAAEGDERLEAVRLRRRVDRGSSQAPERVVATDLLCVGYGFSASTELARLAGCRLGWDIGLSQTVPVFDAWQCTSQPGIFVAGEACGLGGAEVAAVEGELAAVGVARHLGRLAESDAVRMAGPARRRLRGLRAFAAILPRIFPRPSELGALADGETTVCRCENVTLDEVLRAVEDSAATNLNEVKTTTRCGMGWCQGRICGSVLPVVLAPGRPNFDAASQFTARNPIRPISAGQMAALERGAGR